MTGHGGGCHRRGDGARARVGPRRRAPSISTPSGRTSGCPASRSRRSSPSGSSTSRTSSRSPSDAQGSTHLQDHPGLHPGAAARAPPVRSGLPDRDPALRGSQQPGHRELLRPRARARWTSRAGSRSPLKEDFAHTSDPPNTELTGPIESSTKFCRALDRVRLDATVFDRPGLHVHSRELRSGQPGSRTSIATSTGGAHRVLQDPAQDRPARELRLRREGVHRASDRNRQSLPVLVGVRGDITSRLSSTLRVGFESRQPDRSDLAEYNGLVASGDIAYLAHRAHQLTLSLERSMQESVFQSNLWYLATWPSLLGRAFLHVQAAGHRANLRRVERLSGQGAEGRPLVGLAAGLAPRRLHRREYQIQKWLAVSADYTFTRRESNFDTLSTSRTTSSAGR